MSESPKKHLEELCDAVAYALEALDREMEKPSTPQRGRNISMIANSLDMALDAALHFGIGLSFKRIKNRKAKLVQKYFTAKEPMLAANAGDTTA